MHADVLHPRGADDDLTMPVVMALALHVGLVAILLVAGWWQPLPKVVSVAGPVVEAALVVSPADVRTAEAAVEAAPKPAERAPVETAPPPQPLPAPQPQTEVEEIQPEPQEAQPEPAPVDQEAVARLALEQQQAKEREEQEAKARQEQIDLTERQKQAEAERKQRMREQLEEIRKEREAAERRTKMEEQRLQQLADAQAKPPAPTPQPAREPVQAGGNNGTDTDLAARYALAMHQTAQAGWNRALAPERVACKVRFTQIPGGDVIDVQFLSCGFDAQGRESVERALRRSPMPYAGFEPVFQRQIDLTFCYPEEACPR